MEMYYLLIAMWTYSSVVIPEKYNREQCEQAGLASGKYYVCVKAPPSSPISTFSTIQKCGYFPGSNIMTCNN